MQNKTLLSLFGQDIKNYVDLNCLLASVLIMNARKLSLTKVQYLKSATDSSVLNTYLEG